MSTLAMSREEFCALLPTPQQSRRRRREAEQRRLAVCAKLTELIDGITKQHPGKTPREIAAALPVDEATFLLELVDRLEIESQEYRQVPR